MRVLIAVVFLALAPVNAAELTLQQIEPPLAFAEACEYLVGRPELELFQSDWFDQFQRHFIGFMTRTEEGEELRIYGHWWPRFGPTSAKLLRFPILVINGKVIDSFHHPRTKELPEVLYTGRRIAAALAYVSGKQLYIWWARPLFETDDSDAVLTQYSPMRRAIVVRQSRNLPAETFLLSPSWSLGTDEDGIEHWELEISGYVPGGGNESIQYLGSFAITDEGVHVEPIPHPALHINPTRRP